MSPGTCHVRILAENSFTNEEEKVGIRGTKKWTIINNDCAIKRGGKVEHRQIRWGRHQAQKNIILPVFNRNFELFSLCLKYRSTSKRII